MNRNSRILYALASLFLISACQTMREVESTLVADGRPPVAQAEPDSGARDVAVPDLDMRREDEASLSQVDRLQRENRELAGRIAGAERDRQTAIEERDRAVTSERELVSQNMDYQDLLKAGTEREESLKAQLLHAQIENVRLKQELANQRIRELSAGAGH